MVDESLGRLSGFRYRDRVEALDVFNTRFRGSSRQSYIRLWRGSRDHCLLSDSCMLSLNLFEVSVDEHDSFLRR